MKFFIDTAKVEDIKAANDMGVICGVTTNPSLIAKEGRDFKEVIKEITSIVVKFKSIYILLYQISTKAFSAIVFSAFFFARTSQQVNNIFLSLCFHSVKKCFCI